MNPSNPQDAEQCATVEGHDDKPGQHNDPEQLIEQYATVEGHDAKPGQHNDPQQFTTMETDAAELCQSLLHDEFFLEAYVVHPKYHGDLEQVCQKCAHKPPILGFLKAEVPVFATTCVHKSCEGCGRALKELIGLHCIHDPCAEVIGSRTVWPKQSGYVDECENLDFWNGLQISGWPIDLMKTVCLEERLCHERDLKGLAKLHESLVDGNTRALRAKITDFRKGLFDVEGYSQPSKYKELAQELISAQEKDAPSASKKATEEPTQQSLFKRATNSFVIVNGTAALLSYVVASVASHVMLWASNTMLIAHHHASGTSRSDWAAFTFNLAFMVQVLVNVKLL